MPLATVYRQLGLYAPEALRYVNPPTRKSDARRHGNFALR
jgi:hypothetical protein